MYNKLFFLIGGLKSSLEARWSQRKIWVANSSTPVRYNIQSSLVCEGSTFDGKKKLKKSVKIPLTPVLSQSRKVLKELTANTSPSGAQDKEVTG